MEIFHWCYRDKEFISTVTQRLMMGSLKMGRWMDLGYLLIGMGHDMKESI